MKKFSAAVTFVMVWGIVLFCLFSTSVYAFEDTTIHIGNQAQSLKDALEMIPAHAGDVKIVIDYDYTENCRFKEDGWQAKFEIPEDRGITSVTITGNGRRRTIKSNSSIKPVLVTNGVPLTIDYGIDMEASQFILVGGSYAGYDHPHRSVDESSLTVNGAVLWIYGGGFSGVNGSTSEVDQVNVTLNGYAERVYSGGRVNAGETYVHSAKLTFGNESQLGYGICFGGFTVNVNQPSAVVDQTDIYWNAGGNNVPVITDSTYCNMVEAASPSLH